MLLIVLICIGGATSALPIVSDPHSANKRESENTNSSVFQDFLDQGMELMYSDPEQSLLFFKRAEKLATASNDLEQLAQVNQLLSIYYWARGDFEKAMVCDRIALSKYKALGEVYGTGYALNGLAVTLIDMGMNYEALKNLLEAEKIFLDLQDSLALQMVYLNLGVAFDNLEELDEAMKSYQKALILGLKLGLYNEIGDVYNNMAEISRKEKHYDQAYLYYQKAKQIYLRVADKPGIALIKGNLAEYFTQTGQYDSAAHYFEQSLADHIEIADKHGIGGVHLGMGELYLLSGRHDLSEAHLDTAMDIARENQYLDIIIDTQYHLALLKFEQKEYDEGFRHFLKYDAAKDSLNRASSSTEFKNLQMVYEAEEKQHQLEALEAQNEKEQIINSQQIRLRNALLAIVILLAVLLITGMYLYLRLRAVNQKLYGHQVILKNKNREIAETADQLKSANARLLNEKKLAEISSEAKAEFVSVLSHEIRTPLNAIIGISHAMQEDAKDQEQHEYLSALLHSANTLLAFTNNILDLSRLDAGKIDVKKESIYTRLLLDQIIRTFEPSLKAKQLRLKKHIDEQIPEVIIGDKTRLTQVLLNLISNAVKYTEAGEIKVMLACQHLSATELEMRITIKDTGTGISPELQPRIFDRYSRLQSESTLTPQGSGLGLSITKSLVDLLGGTIEFESTKGVGSSFVVRLKFERPASHSATLQARTGPAARTENIIGKSLLLVEDNEVNVMFTERLLKKLNMNVEVARDGKEAVEKARNQSFDLILMDLQMPKMNGIDAASAILSENPDTRIIALTANTDHHIKQKLTETGFRGLLIKPFNPNELGEKIGRWIYS